MKECLDKKLRGSANGPIKKFTLLELLIVICTIAILISILLPSLRSAKVKAISAVCLSNTYQSYVFTQEYSIDNNRKIPPSMRQVDNVWNRSWQDHVYVYFDSSFDYEQIGHYPALRASWGQKNSFICPAADKDNIEALTGQVEPWTSYFASYGLNSHFINNDTGIGDVGETRFFDKLDNTSILYAEGSSTGVLDIHLYPSVYGVWPRHLNYANYTFTDGHSETSRKHHMGGFSKWQDSPWNPEK